MPNQMPNSIQNIQSPKANLTLITTNTFTYPFSSPSPSHPSLPPAKPNTPSPQIHPPTRPSPSKPRAPITHHSPPPSPRQQCQQQNHPRAHPRNQRTHNPHHQARKGTAAPATFDPFLWASNQAARAASGIHCRHHHHRRHRWWWCC